MRIKWAKVITTGLLLSVVLGLTTNTLNSNINNGGYNLNEIKNSRSENPMDGTTDYLEGSFILDAQMNEYATYAVFYDNDGSNEIRSWGYNNYGLLGNSSTTEADKLGWAESAHVDIDMTGKTFKFMETLNDTVYVVITDNATGMDEIYAWGNNDKGQLFIDPSTKFVSTPTRILEDKIESWMYITGIDAGVGSTVVYAQGLEGQEYDPESYNGENIYAIGAGDTSRNQDPTGTLFTTGVMKEGMRYVSSDASDYAYSLAVSDSKYGDREANETIIDWGDNYNNIMGLKEGSDPVEGYIVVDWDTEVVGTDGVITNPDPVNKFVYDIIAGENNFYYESTESALYSTGDRMINADYQGQDALTYENGINKVDGMGAAGHDFGDYNSSNWGDISAGADFVVLNKEDWYPTDGTGDGYYVGGNFAYTEKTYMFGYDTNGQLGNGDDFGDSTQTGGKGQNTEYQYIYRKTDTPAGEYDTWNFLRSSDVSRRTSSNKHATIQNNVYTEAYWTTLSAYGSNSNGVFDKYGTDNLPEQQSPIEIGSQNSGDIDFASIPVEVVESELKPFSMQFTVDTTNRDLGFINPNSYFFEVRDKDTGVVLEDNINVVSMDEGMTTYEITNLEQLQTYTFEYTFTGEDDDWIGEFTVTTPELLAAEPTVESADIFYMNENEFDRRERAYLSWNIIDNTDPDGLQANLRNIKFIGDVTDQYGTLVEDVEIASIDDPDWSEREFGFDFPETIKPGSTITNIRLDVYANNLVDPITFTEIDDFKLEDYPGFEEPDSENIFEEPAVTQTTAEAGFNIYFNEGEHTPGTPQFNEIEFVDIDQKINPDDIRVEYTTTEPFEWGMSGKIYFDNLTPGLYYDSTKIRFSWIVDGVEYEKIESIDRFLTEPWIAPEQPIPTFELVETGVTTALFDWQVTLPEPTQELQSEILIDNIEIYDKNSDYVQDITFDGELDSGVITGQSLIRRLEADTTYELALRVNYSDVSLGNVSSVETTDTITITTESLLPPVQPQILEDQFVVTTTGSSISIEYSIRTYKSWEYSDNIKTELSSIKIYSDDGVTVLAEESEENLIDSDDDGIVSGELEITGLQKQTDYSWYMVVESNAEDVISSTFTSTTDNSFNWTILLIVLAVIILLIVLIILLS